MKHLAIATATSVMILSGCCGLPQRPFRPEFSVSCQPTVQGYTFRIVNYSSQDVLVQYPFVRIMLIHDMDDDGNPTEDVTDVLLPVSWAYFPLAHSVRGTRYLAPGQVLTKDISFYQMGLDQAQAARQVKELRVVIESCPIRGGGKGFNDIKEWYGTFVRKEAIADLLKEAEIER